MRPGRMHKGGKARQEEQRRLIHWEGGEVQTRGWMQEAGARRQGGQEPGPASDTARSNGPYQREGTKTLTIMLLKKKVLLLNEVTVSAPRSESGSWFQKRGA